MNEKHNNEEPQPPSGLFNKIKKYFRNPFFIKTQSVSEVTDFLKDAVDQNIIDKEAESIATKAIKLGDITVKEIMIPKIDMVTIQIDENTTDVITKIIDSGHSRYPVLGKERDEVVTKNFFSKGIPLCGVLGGGYNKDPKKLVELHSFLHQSCAKLI